MNTKLCLKRCSGIVFSGFVLLCIGTGCHNPVTEIQDFGYPTFQAQKLQAGDLLIPAEESQLAQAMKKVDVPENTRTMLTVSALDLPYWALKTRTLPAFDNIAMIGLDVDGIKSVNVKAETIVPFVQRIYLLTKDNQLYYTTDWKNGGLATLPQNAITFSSNSYRWKVTPAGEIHVSGKVDPFIAATAGICFEILYQDNATGYIKVVKPDVYAAKCQMNLFPKQPDPIPDYPKVRKASNGRPGAEGRRGAMGSAAQPGTPGRGGSFSGASGYNGGDGYHGGRGAIGEEGKEGSRGEDGRNGAEGRDGVHGADGLNITVKIYPAYDAYHGKEIILVHTEKNESGIKVTEKQVLLPDAAIEIMANGAQGGIGGKGEDGGDGGNGGRGGKGGSGGDGGNGGNGGDGGNGAAGSTATKYSPGGNGGDGGKGGNGGDGGDGGDGGKGGRGGDGGNGGNGGNGGRGGDGGMGSNVLVYIYGNDFFARKVQQAVTVNVNGGKGGPGGQGGAAGQGGFGGIAGLGGDPGKGGERGKWGKGGDAGAGGRSHTWVEMTYIGDYTIPVPKHSPGGYKGTDGSNGYWGKYGKSGKRGASGTRGNRGKHGKSGARGLRGNNGKSGNVTVKIVK